MSSACFFTRGGPLEPAELQLIAHRFAVLSDPLRLRLVHALFAGEKSVSELIAATGGSQTNVSRDLQMLTQAKVLARRKEGLRVFYAIADPTIFALCQLVCAGLETALAQQAAVLGGDSRKRPASKQAPVRSRRGPSRTSGEA